MDDAPLLTAAEAASRLGVKRQTLYAYVSRGLVSRQLSLDGRTSLFRPAEIDALRSAHRRTPSGEVGSVIASSVTRIEPTGHSYRGTNAIDLADEPLEAVAELLWGGTGGDRARDDWARDDWALDDWALDDKALATVVALQAALPGHAELIDRLRGSVLALSTHDQLRHDPTPDAHRRAGRRMLTAMVDGLPVLPCDDAAGSASERLPTGERLADRLWPRLSRRAPTEARLDCLNAALVLMADHGLAASTFAARIAASVRADPYSVVSAGLGAMGGVLHGAASDDVHDLFDDAVRLGPEAAVGRHLRDGRRISGTGHAVYRDRDPREAALTERLTDAWAGDERLEVVHAMRTVIGERVDRPLNVDFALGALTWLAEMEPGSGQCIFVARAAGWIAHGIEEMTERPLRFRAVARPRPQRPDLPEDAADAEANGG